MTGLASAGHADADITKAHAARLEKGYPSVLDLASMQGQGNAMFPDARRHAPATARNREPIFELLKSVLPPSGLVLEIASGTGEHAVHFARGLPALQWQPSDPDGSALESIAAWRAAEGSSNLLAPVLLDAAADHWPVCSADAAVCINMVHISPWDATLGLMSGAGRILGQGAPLVLYGPYRRAGKPLEQSNQAFDDDLRRRDPRWGLRSVEDVQAAAGDRGLEFETLVEMPANNLCLVFRKR